MATADSHRETASKDCLRSAVKKTPLARCLFYGAPKRIRSERSERNSDCCALRQSRQQWVLSPPVRYDKTAIKIAVFEWYTQADLNRQPSESESDALSSCAMGAYRRFRFVRLNYSTLVRISKPNAKFSACNILVTYRYVGDIIISTTKFGLNRVGKTDFTIS